MRIGITGISGYLGTLLSRRLVESGAVESVTGVDLREPSFRHEKIRFVKCDIRDSTLARALEGCDTVVHLTFVVQEIRDKGLTYDINLNGTKNLLGACDTNRPRKLVVASSVAAYGCVPRSGAITEDSDLRGNRGSYYSDTKRIVEGMLDDFEKENQGMVVTRMRPSIFCGRNVNNFFMDAVRLPVVTYIRGNPYGLPLVYEGDVAGAFYTVIMEDHPGAFNIHTGSLTIKRMSEILGKRAIGIPYRLAKAIAALGFWIGITKFSGHWVELGRYPMDISAEKARRVLNWKPTKTPEQAFVEMVDSLRARQGGRHEGSAAEGGNE
ncbi:MAG: NAD-dependent epimerase/dehydratase family protein [Deltaproteobacteria bacterium]|nr:NAD-dependent epimerase/dehydratase family protein [Deltaproteobacteria bacterium]